MDQDKQFEAEIAPFFWVEYKGGCSVCLNAGTYLQEVFDAAGDFEGGGYDWASLAQVFLEERLPALAEKIEFDPEADLFSACSQDGQALRSFIQAFKGACEDRALILDLLSRAEPD